jgi:hypothetical protein
VKTTNDTGRLFTVGWPKRWAAVCKTSGCTFRTEAGDEAEATQNAIEHTKTRRSCVVWVVQRHDHGGEVITNIIERRPFGRRRR